MGKLRQLIADTLLVRIVAGSLLGGIVLFGLASCGEPAGSPPTLHPNTSIPTESSAPIATPTITVAEAPATQQPTPAAVTNPSEVAQESFLPLVNFAEGVGATATATATPFPTPTPTIDFAAVRANLNANGNDLGYVKFGFHATVGGNQTGLGEWMRELDAAGIPIFLKSVDDAGPLFAAQQLMQQGDVPHTLVYRRSGNAYDVPNYDLPPAESARQHWALHKAAFPPELDPNLVWIETLNEVDKERSIWLAEFALVTAELALADGFRWVAFGWSSGEPEPTDWESEPMLAFLRLVASRPEQLAISLHEHSFLHDNIGHLYPYKLGRFQQLFTVADRHNIPRPTVMITEWGWEYRHTPDPARAMADIEWASRLYANYPEIIGAAIWSLGCCFDPVDDQTQQLIAPLTLYAKSTYFVIPLPPVQAPIEPDRYQP